MPTLLWADDEIDLLKPHLLFLKAKGYDIVTANSGTDALALVESQNFDLIILDENMPGLTGLETLQRIKMASPHIPVIMITKSEEENIMDQAVGNKIADYLIKPVNPSQILLSIKKNLHSERLVSDVASTDYRQEFARISMSIGEATTIGDWMELYRRLIHWELQLSQAEQGMADLLLMQKQEAEGAFAKFVSRNYEDWVTPDPKGLPREGHPLMSTDVFKSRIFPLLDAGEKVWMVLIDNFRYDQWAVIKPLLADMFTFNDELYTSILPTATQYARNAIFSGLMPLEIAKAFPDLWVDEDSPEGKNLNESPLIATQFERYRRKCRFSYTKINDSTAGDKLLREFSNLRSNDLNVVVINFIDMLSHF
ncbi:MAG: PglZ domain-containing protein, partial [Duncaniella sp.]|nr:PglZ domain-containing protein [Duncaniella sp.]